MAVTLLRHRDRIATPWKNGGGLTREIAAWPPGAGLTDFDWRVSLATVARAGPFSPFPGVDRILTVVEGDLSMAVGGAPWRTLTADSEPLVFPGEATVDAGAPAGPATDVNVMTRRDRVAATVERRFAAGPIDLGVARWMLILACDSGDIDVEGRPERVERFDALLVDRTQGPRRVNLTANVHIILAKLIAV